jgi:hypothetical protein
MQGKPIRLLVVSVIVQIDVNRRRQTRHDLGNGKANTTGTARWERPFAAIRQHSILRCSHLNKTPA